VKHVGLNHLKDGTSNPTLSRDTFGAQLFPLPPLAEQKAIAAVLGALDDKIELNRRMNATLEATARALFQSWFVDFDPVRAKLDGRKPDGLDKPIAALFPAAFQDSPLGPIPKGWAVARLDDIASVMMGLSPDGDSYNSDGVGVPLINGPVEFGDYFPVKTKWTQASTRFAAEGDLIFCVRGSTTGRRVVSDGEYGIGRGVCAIRAKDKLDSLLYQTINVGLERLLEKTTGSVFPSLSAPDIKGFSVLKPNGDVQQLYERTTKPLVQSIQQNHRQSRTLATLRDTLLPKLLSGEVSVGDARRYAGDII
jgi:type I restriction enzyme S subunit